MSRQQAPATPGPGETFAGQWPCEGRRTGRIQGPYYRISGPRSRAGSRPRPVTARASRRRSRRRARRPDSARRTVRCLPRSAAHRSAEHRAIFLRAAFITPHAKGHERLAGNWLAPDPNGGELPLGPFDLQPRIGDPYPQEPEVPLKTDVAAVPQDSRPVWRPCRLVAGHGEDEERTWGRARAVGNGALAVGKAAEVPEERAFDSPAQAARAGSR